MENPYAPPTAQGTERDARKRWWWLDGALAVVFLIFLTPSALLNFILLVQQIQGLGIFDPALGAESPWLRRAFAQPGIIFLLIAVWLYWSRQEGRPRAGRFLLGLVGGLALLTTLAGLVPGPSWAP